MRLIDADKNREDFKKTLYSILEDDSSTSKVKFNKIMTAFDSMPTAYSVDKVTEELNKLDVQAIKRYKGGTFGDYEGTDYYIKKSDAIEIVKAGVKDE